MNRRKILLAMSVVAVFIAVVSSQKEAGAQSSKKTFLSRDRQTIEDRMEQRGNLQQQRHDEAARLRAERESADPTLAARRKEARAAAEITMKARIEALNKSKDSQSSFNDSEIRVASDKEAQARKAVARQAESNGR